jgi:hypothetical protein
MHTYPFDERVGALANPSSHDRVPAFVDDARLHSRRIYSRDSSGRRRQGFGQTEFHATAVREDRGHGLAGGCILEQLHVVASSWRAF